ncbi:MAG: amidohydrolase family protein [Solirubrobacteraceae bacterium]
MSTSRAGCRVRATVNPEMLPSIVELAHHNLAEGSASLRAAAAAGVPIALGSDRDGVSGDDAALELARMVHHGMSARAALHAATGAAAAAIGLDSRIGTITPGKFADLVAVDGDVIAHPELLLERDRIRLVFQLGELVAGAAVEGAQRVS